ncbi:MAG TPA: PTS sugar transporter subunit IIA [Usitatibacter sp.]|nr:PTS sugar transporter subunit IIA [Usitatibacter sp.]
MNPLVPLLRDDEIVLDADVHDREALFRMAADLIAARNGLHGQEVYQALMERERLGSTAVGHGIAIPHARMPRIAHPASAYVRTRGPLAFGAPDGKPVSQFLFLLVPADANERHLQLMAAAAAALSDPDVRSGLASCRRVEEVRRIMSGWDEPDAPIRAS